MSVESLIGVFNGELEEAKRKRKPLEDDWLKAYRQFYSVYDGDVEIAENASHLYVGITRQKVMAAWQRICDIMFNRAELPWTVEASPEPNIPVRRVLREIFDALPPEAKQAVAMEGPEAILARLDEQSLTDVSREIAQKAAVEMSHEIADAWEEDRASIKIRHALLEMVITGSCIIKTGTTQRNVSRWGAIDGQFDYKPKTKFSPTIKYVSIFDVWFDPYAKLVIDNGTIDSCEYVYERHVFTRSQLYDLIDAPEGVFNREAILRLLHDGENSEELQSDRDMRNMRGETTSSGKNRWDVWERSGYMTVRQLREAGIEIGEDEEGVINANIWYSGNEIIKAVRNPNKPNKLNYYLCPYEISPGQLYGIGIPYRMRHSQALLNSCVRLFIDNKANASGPVFFYDEDAWNPENGLPEDQIQPWAFIPFNTSVGKSLRDILHVVTVPDVSNQLISLIELAKHTADDESNVPSFAHSAQNPELTKATGGTLGGMSILMNAYDLGNKTVVRNVDEFIITPVITAFYDWFMQYSPREEIKGDMNIIAHGVTGLMKKEVQSQRMMQLLATTANPVDLQLFGPVRREMWLDALESMDVDTRKYKALTNPQQGQPVQGQPVPPPQGPSGGVPGSPGQQQMPGGPVPMPGQG